MFVGLLRFVVFKEFWREVFGVKMDGNCVVWVDFAFLDLFDHSLEATRIKLLGNTARRGGGAQEFVPDLKEENSDGFSTEFKENFNKIDDF